MKDKCEGILLFGYTLPCTYAFVIKTFHSGVQETWLSSVIFKMRWAPGRELNCSHKQNAGTFWLWLISLYSTGHFGSYPSTILKLNKADLQHKFLPSLLQHVIPTVHLVHFFPIGIKLSLFWKKQQQKKTVLIVNQIWNSLLPKLRRPVCKSGVWSLSRAEAVWAVRRGVVMSCPRAACRWWGGSPQQVRGSQCWGLVLRYVCLPAMGQKLSSRSCPQPGGWWYLRGTEVCPTLLPRLFHVFYSHFLAHFCTYTPFSVRQISILHMDSIRWGLQLRLGLTNVKASISKYLKEDNFVLILDILHWNLNVSESIQV